MALAAKEIVCEGAPLGRQDFYLRLEDTLLSTKPSIDQFGHRHYPIPGVQILQPVGSDRPNLDMVVIHPKGSPFLLQ